MKKIFLTFALLFFGVSILAPSIGPEVLANTTSAIEESGCTEADRAAGYCVSLSEGLGRTTKITGDDGIELISAYIGVIYRYIASLVGIICVAIIVVSGIQISLGGVSNEAVSNGKARIMNALISLVLVFATGLILRTINPGFFVNDGSGTPASQSERTVPDSTPVPQSKPKPTSAASVPAEAPVPTLTPRTPALLVDGKFGEQSAAARDAVPGLAVSCGVTSTRAADSFSSSADYDRGQNAANVRAFQGAYNAGKSEC